MLHLREIKSVFITVIGFCIIGLGLLYTYHKLHHALDEASMAIQEDMKSRISPLGIAARLKFELEDYTYTELERTGGEPRKIFTISGRKLETKYPKLGIFRIGIGYTIELEEPSITFYKDNRKVSTAHAKNGKINLLTRNIEFYGNVGLITTTYSTLSCDKLTWANEEEMLDAQGDCTLRSERNTVNAERVETDTALKRFRVKDKASLLAKIIDGGVR